MSEDQKPQNSTTGVIRSWPDDAPHPFKGKTIADMKPTGSWWHKGWVIYFTDGTWFSTHPTGDQADHTTPELRCTQRG